MTGRATFARAHRIQSPSRRTCVPTTHLRDRIRRWHGRRWASLCAEDLALDADGRALRIDKAYSWESPLAAHGLMHMVIANAAAGDPYPIDTLMLLSWTKFQDA